MEPNVTTATDAIVQLATQFNAGVFGGVLNLLYILLGFQALRILFKIVWGNRGEKFVEEKEEQYKDFTNKIEEEVKKVGDEVSKKLDKKKSKRKFHLQKETPICKDEKVCKEEAKEDKDSDIKLTDSKFEDTKFE